MIPTLLHSVRKAVLCAASLATLASLTGALGTPPQVSLDQTAYETGQDVVITVTGDPGTIPVAIIGDRLSPTTIPSIGTIDIELRPETLIVVMPVIDNTGTSKLYCPSRCSQVLLERPFYVQAVTFKVGPLRACGVSNYEQVNFVSGNCGQCVDAAPTDAYAKYGGGHALWLPDIARDFVFVSGGTLVERADGSAQLLGVLESVSDPSLCFHVDVSFTKRIDAGTAQNPPSGSPKKELKDSAYAEFGGPVVTDDWHYYEETNGTLYGCNALSGAVISLTRKGPAFQVGMGANGKNIGFGGSGWLMANVTSQPTSGPALPTTTMRGDFNLNLGGDCGDCATKAKNHAIYLPGLGPRYVFENGSGNFQELKNGTATLKGRVVSTANPNHAFDVDVFFTSRMNTGMPGHPPAGSPKKELASHHYSENGGPVDTSTWHYYEVTGGSLIGLRDFAGGQVDVTRKGPAFQVGIGANGKKPEYGASGWFDYVVSSQPSGGASLPTSGRGDFNLRLSEDCR